MTSVRLAPPTDAPEVEVARDLGRRALWLVAPALVGGLLAGGWQGAASALYGLALVVGNFLLAAYAMARAARISVHVLMATVLGSYIVRMALIAAAVLAVSGAGWFRPIPLGGTLIAAHLVLLMWETRYVSASLAFPGLKPVGTSPARH
ncbi:MAG: ATP synthase subunit I [Acidimicrobiia bacterium]|nr:ATP synthase subunit I [Acidimicrobiia bacterium]